MNQIRAAWKFFVTDNGTKLLGFLQITLGALVAVPQAFPATWLPYMMLATGLATAWRGFLNSQRA